jgi:Carboxypeptidase regulatory-like domain/Bacterial Ig-like domain (group 2)
MRPGGLAAAMICAAALSACSSSSSSNPTAPTTPTPTPTTVSAVTVTSPSTSGASFQLTATARMSDGSTHDVTSTASWQSSNAQLASVSATGLVTVHATGEVDLKATYQSVTGSLHASVSMARTFTISGFVTEAAPNTRALSGVRVQIVVGGYAFSDERGAFAISGLPSGRTLIEFTKDGYQTIEKDTTLADQDMQLAVTLYPVPPKNADGATATARCNDGSWSWAQTLAGACTANGGIAYTVCPGTLCTP